MDGSHDSLESFSCILLDLRAGHESARFELSSFPVGNSVRTGRTLIRVGSQPSLPERFPVVRLAKPLLRLAALDYKTGLFDF